MNLNLTCVSLKALLHFSNPSLGDVAKRLGRGLQNLEHRFESGRRLHAKNQCLGGEIGRRTGLKILRSLLCAGSIPALGTTNDGALRDSSILKTVLKNKATLNNTSCRLP